jgi:predicted metal-binding protein
LSVLKPAADGPSLVVCSTCRFSAKEREDADGARGGALLAKAVRAAAEGDPRVDGLAIEEMPCLFNCTQHCSIHVRAPDKIGYVLGRFEPTAESAQAIVDYLAEYLQSEEGVVPYRRWPEGVKGHFIVRTPPHGRIVGA